MQPGAPRPILQKHSKIFLAFCTDFCYTSYVTAARGWEYAHLGVPFSRILCRRQIKFYKEVLLL